MPETLIVKLDTKNEKTAADLSEAVSDTPGFMISRNGTPDCDVMFIEIGADLNEFKMVEHLKAAGAVRVVFLTSPRNDSEILLKAMKTGVKEFFPQPINKAEVVSSLIKLKRSAEGREKKTGKNGLLVSVIGSKGGVGATTTAVNLAVSLKEIAPNKAVALVDMNPLMGAVPLFLDIKSSFSWADGARDIARVDSTYLLNTVYKHQSGVHVLPAPVRAEDLDVATPETIEKLIRLMKSAFDVIVMDGCKSFDDLSLRALSLSDTILVVSELNLLSLVNARKLIETFDGLGLSHEKTIKVVITRHSKTTMITPKEAEKTIGKEIISMIPNDYETTMTAINTGKTLFDLDTTSPLVEHFRKLSGALLNKEDVKKEKSVFPFKFFSKGLKNISDGALKFTGLKGNGEA